MFVPRLPAGSHSRESWRPGTMQAEKPTWPADACPSERGVSQHGTGRQCICSSSRQEVMHATAAGEELHFSSRARGDVTCFGVWLAYGNELTHSRDTAREYPVRHTGLTRSCKSWSMLVAHVDIASPCFILLAQISPLRLLWEIVG